MLRVLLSITVAVCCGTANAEVTKSDGNFYCGAIADWDLSNFRLSPDLVVNNFVFDQRNSFLASGLDVLELTYSATSRRNDPTPFNSQVVALTSNSGLVAAFEVNPVFDLLSSNTTETLSGDTYILPIAWSQIEKFCIAFVHE